MILTKLIVINKGAAMKFLLMFVKGLLVVMPFISPVIVFSQTAIPDFSKGVNRESIPSTIKKTMWGAQNGPFIADALIESDEANIYYWLFRTSSINRFNVSNAQNLGGWPLIRWTHQYFSSAIEAHYKELNHPYPLQFDYEGVGAGIGCLGNSPLRLGDLEEDGQKDIVIMLKGLFIVFSLQYERTVFAEPIDESDWMSKDEMTQFFSQNPVTGIQYTSRVLANNKIISAGIRAYAKLYVGDYDEDGNQDIVVWRKSYQSNDGSNPVIGFTMLEDVYQHFERDITAQASLPEGVTGEYLPMGTDEDTIKQWLASGNLTWSKGYPSQSECEGQTDQLIPEMHDVLLNDPDVLL